MIPIELSSLARQHLENLPNRIALRITEKLRWFSEQADPLKFAVALSGTKEKLFRFRVGDYRAIFMMKDGIPTVLMVIAVKHRGKAYR